MKIDARSLRYALVVPVMPAMSVVPLGEAQEYPEPMSYRFRWTGDVRWENKFGEVVKDTDREFHAKGPVPLFIFEEET